jgi:predicted nucleic acid-binding protein
VTKVFWDTNLFIYLLEDHPRLADRVGKLRRTMITRGDELCTSALTVGEILVKPVSQNRTDLEDRYTSFFRGRAVSVLPFDLGAAACYARIRQDKGIRPPDAVQLACAAAANTDLFITNDDRWSNKTVAGINLIVSLSRAPI